jgi:hypothetical protein
VRVLRRKLLSAIFVVLPATAALTVVEAASGECRTKPGTTAPLGSRWVYRVDRVDHRRCWFVSSQGARSHSYMRRTASGWHRHLVRHSTRDVLNVRYDHPIGPETASTQTGPTDTMLPLEPATHRDFAARWPDPPGSQDLLRRKIATITYARPANGASTSSTPLSGIERAGEQSSVGNALNSVLLGGALTTSLFVAGGISYVVRRRRRRDARYRNAVEPHRRTVVPSRSGTPTENKWPMQTRHHISGRQASPPIAPADDHEADLHHTALDLRWSIFGESLGRVRKITGL